MESHLTRMIRVSFFLIAACAAWAQTPAPAAPKGSDPVVTINGRVWTRSEWDEFVDSMTESNRASYQTNPVEFVRQLAIIDHLTKKAQEEKFLEKDPHRMRYYLEQRKMIASFFQEHTQNMTTASDAEIKAFYDKNADRFTAVTLKMIFLSPGAGGNDMAVAARAQQIYEQAAKGGDFVKLVRENSEEIGSKGRDGDLGEVRKSDPLPDEVKAVVFKMKKGDISKPVRAKSGFYIFRCEDAKTESFDEVKGALATEVRQRKYIEWFENERKKADVQFQRQDYFNSK